MLVSVVIPTYNRAADLRRALVSLQGQTYANWEALIIDNHSDDNTEEVVASLNDSRCIIFKVHNRGVIALSRNVGVRKAKGDVIAFLDSDDWWTANKLERSLELLQSGYDLVYHDLWLVTDISRQQAKKVGSWPLSHPIFDSLIQTGNPVINSSVVVRTDIIRKVDGLSEARELTAAEDFDCWLRISRITDRFAFIPETLGFYWHGTGNTSNYQRSIVHLTTLKQLYIDPYIKEQDAAMPAWFAYVYARALFMTGRYGEAFILLKQLVMRKIALHTRAKVAWMLMVCCWKLRTSLS